MKIHIFGASGSGVTTLGKALAQNLNIPYFDSDDYFWKKSDPPFTIRRNSNERNTMIAGALNKSDCWIFGGSIIDWGSDVFPVFDLVVFLLIPPEIRIERLRKREIERYGEIVILDPDRKKKLDVFINWAADYDNCTGIANRNIKAHENWLSNGNFPVLKVKGDFTVEERLKFILDKLNNE